MRLILLLLVVGFATLGCCEEGDKPTLACYKGPFSYSDGTHFDEKLKLVSAQSCFTYFSTDCSIILHDENKTNADFSRLFKEGKIEHKADYTVVECNSDGCNYNLKSQMTQLKDKNNTLYDQCGDKYTELAKQKRGIPSIICFRGKFSDAKGDSKSQELVCFTVLPYQNEKCITVFFHDCSIVFGHESNGMRIIPGLQEGEGEEHTKITCDSDECNYNMTSMMSKLEKENPNLYNDCKSTYEKVIKDYKPVRVPTNNLICARNWSPEKGSDSAWEPLEIAESRPYCGIQFTQGDCLKFASSPYPRISALNTCVKRDEDEVQRIACYCTSGDLCNTDIEKWAAEARNLEGSDFMKDCDYTGYNYPKPWQFTTTTEATTIESTTVATTTFKSLQNQPPASNSVPLSTAASFALLLLMA